VKCDHCIERQRQGASPACVEACKVGALVWGEINDLVKTARTRYSEVVSMAVGQIPEEMKAIPANVNAWHAYGAEVSKLNATGEKGA
jgi:carbon-monoxide dehydrogenase iron sulfur subunit